MSAKLSRETAQRRPVGRFHFCFQRDSPPSSRACCSPPCWCWCRGRLPRDSPETPPSPAELPAGQSSPRSHRNSATPSHPGSPCGSQADGKLLSEGKDGSWGASHTGLPTRSDPPLRAAPPLPIPLPTLLPAPTPPGFTLLKEGVKGKETLAPA